MHTNIDIDDDLLTEAMAASGLSTKKATVEEALRRLVQGYRRRADMTGLGWDGDLGRDAGRAGDRSGPVIVIDSSVWIGFCGIRTARRCAGCEISSTRRMTRFWLEI